MNEKRFYDVRDVSRFMGISTSKAYKIIHKMNEELQEQGYITVAGKVSKLYFDEKIYGSRAM